MDPRLLPIRSTMHVLDIGAMSEGVPRHQPLVEKFGAHVTGFEPNSSEFQRLEQNAQQTYLPYFLGTGDEREFRRTRYPGCSSLFEPNAAIIDLFETIGAGTPDGNFFVVSRETVQTHRLDEILSERTAHFIKADVQGAELEVLRGGPETLSTAVVVELEAAFVELYIDQPLFGDVQVFMRDHGFSLHKMIEVAGRTFRPVRRDDNPFAPISQMLWCDAVFVRDFSRMDALSAEQLLHGAIILDEVYQSYDLAHFWLRAYDQQSKASVSLAQAYLQELATRQQLPRNYLTQRLQP